MESKDLKETITKWENGNTKTKIGYRNDGIEKWYETTHWESGNLKTGIAYQSDGVTKDREYTYWENNNIKTEIRYNTSGVKESGYPKCYLESDGRTEETCTQATHNCTFASNTCI